MITTAHMWDGRGGVESKHIAGSLPPPLRASQGVPQEPLAMGVSSYVSA